MDSKKILIIIGFISFIILLSSCNTNYALTYRPAPAIEKTGFPVSNPILIRNVIDQREITEQFPSDPDSDPLILVPFCPYVHTLTSPNPRYTFMQYNMMNTVKHIVADDLKTAGIFSDVETESYDSQNKNAKIPQNAYVLKMIVEKAVWSRYLTSYGLSYAGTLLWTLGAPVSYGSVDLSIKIELFTPNNYITPFSTKIISTTTPCTEFVYEQVNYTPPISEFKVADMFPSIMRQNREFIISSIEEYTTKTK